MEGTLSKWTNVVHGWQHRYFVLNDDVLCYYTSKEKMARGQQRGCIRLRGAALGIDEENNAQFTIAVDGKIFHLQGKHQTERDTWVRALERVIHEKCGYYKPPQEDPIKELEKRANTAENQSQMLKEQTRNLEAINRESEKADQKRKRMLSEILATTKRLQSTVDLSIVLLKQVQRDFGLAEKKKKPTTVEENGRASEEDSRGMSEGTNGNGKADETKDEINLDDVDQVMSYSSSDEEFFDAENEERRGSGGSRDKAKGSGGGSRRGSKESHRSPTHKHHHGHHRASLLSRAESSGGEIDWGDFDAKGVNFDAIYDNQLEKDVGDINKQHGSVLMHLLSQVSVGMDLTKVTLPTFILERRSLLEMYAEFFAHPDDFVSAVALDSAESRFLAVLKYYLNSFYPARKSGVAKKPYNPILGETFRCRWTLPGTTPSPNKVHSGPFPGSSTNQVTYIAEQVSHHPPISAFYAEHPEAQISVCGHIYTKSSFLGLSIGVQNIGHAVIKLHKYNEQYTVTFPNGYGRSIMSTPWIELGGKVEVCCDKTHFRAEIEFLTKPFFRGKPHQLQGAIFYEPPNTVLVGKSKPVMQLKGEWNGHIYMRRGEQGEYSLFSNVRLKPDVRKECIPVKEQTERESRRLWRHVTAALLHNEIEVASQAKRWIEQRQRAEKEKREKLGEQWNTLVFERDAMADDWKYKEALEERQKSKQISQRTDQLD